MLCHTFANAQIKCGEVKVCCRFNCVDRQLRSKRGKLLYKGLQMGQDTEVEVAVGCDMSKKGKELVIQPSRGKGLRRCSLRNTCTVKLRQPL